ncbi:MAG: DNA polymerase IV, partial [Leeuwenhoekiella sp.]
TYMKYSDIVTDVIKDTAPLFEKTSVDEFYVDLTGMDRFFGNYSFASSLRKNIIKESGLPISFGLSVNKTVSKVATGEAKPNNQLKIDKGYEKSFLAPLAIRKIPSIGKVTAQKLVKMGLDRVKLIQDMPLEMMTAFLGKNGKAIWYKAQGVDNSPVKPYSERKSISSERTFNKDTIDMIRLQDTVTAMVDTLCFQLRLGAKMTGCVAIKLRYSDFQTYTKQKKIPYTSAEHKILPVINDLFKQLYQRRILVRLIGIHFSDIVGGHYQIDLFDDNEKELKLYNAMDHLKKRFGSSSVMRASTMDVRTVRSGHNPFDGKPPLLLAHRKI